MTIAYLDPDDEITNAVARLRASKDVRVALVLPAGSRIATSRINFRLLAHEARAHTRRLAVVAAEPGVRAVAISAGLPAYATVAEYEAALHEAGSASAPAEPAGATGPAPRTRKGRTGGPKAASAVDLVSADLASAATLASGAAASPPRPDASAAAPVPGSVTHRGGVPDLPVVAGREPAGRGGQRWIWMGVSGLLVVALVVAGGWIAFNLLPTATITVTPRTQAAPPVDLTVIADPSATAVDLVGAVVPTQVVTVPLTATGTFDATGTKPVDAAATGTVTFTSYNTVNAVTIGQGTEVSTVSGIVFTTTKAITVPQAVVRNLTLEPGVANVGVTAAATGPGGNVAAGSITRVSASIRAKLGHPPNPVTNAAPTTGGTHTVIKVVQQSDYTAAVAALTTMLQDQLVTAGSDPANVPSGVTLIPATATVGATTPDQPASAIVSKAEETFTLALAADGTIQGVEDALVDQVAKARLLSAIPSGYTLFPTTVQTQVGPAVVSGGQISFSASATGQMAATLDPAALFAQVRGKSVAQARTILEALGTVSIETSPFYVSSIPDDATRVTITVQVPQPGSPAAPGTGVPTSLPTSAPSAT